MTTWKNGVVEEFEYLDAILEDPDLIPTKAIMEIFHTQKNIRPIILCV